METSFLRNKKDKLEYKASYGHWGLAVLSWYSSLELIILYPVIVTNWTNKHRPSWPLRMCRWYHVYHVHLQSTYSAQRDSSKWLCFEWTETDRNYSIQPCLEYVSAEYSMLDTHSLVKRLCLFGVYTTTNLTSDLPPLEITISPDPAEQNGDQISIQTSPLINSTSSGAWRSNMEYGVWRSEWFVHHLTTIIAVSGVLSRGNGSWDMALHVYQRYSVQISLRHGVSLEPAECEPWTEVIPRLLSR